MKIVYTGSDVASLYFAIQLKSKLPGCDVRVLDRSKPAAPAPCPVVLSNPLHELPDFGDDELAAAITSKAIPAAGIDLRLDGQRTLLPVPQYTFISSILLQATLRERARSVGCHMTDDGDPGSNLQAADLIVGLWPDTADTIAETPSTLRYRVFRTPAVPQQFGTYLRRTPYGIMHAYHIPETPNLGCLIVETTAAVLARANVSETVDQGAAFCASVFEDDCGPIEATSDTCWHTFAARNAVHWHNDRHVLLGGTAYNSHRSLGLAEYSGFGDAACLASLLTTYVRPAALDAFEQTRRPNADSLARASAASQVFFEHLERYVDAPRAQFDYAFMTRTLRIDHQTMQKLALEIADETETLVAGPARAGKTTAPPMFAPITLRGLTIPNRIVLSPMCMYNATDGTPGDFHLVHYGSRAQGGAGLIITEMTDVSPEGRISPYCTGLYKPEHMTAWKRVVDFVHEFTPAKIGMQLGHAGRKGSVGPRWKRDLGGETWQTLAASSIPFDKNRTTPKEVTREDMTRLVAAFVTATEMTEAAGFDMIELHCAHGYLLSSFISPLSNLRSDDYGGSLENRLRFPLEVFSAVRRAWPADKPICVRISSTDWLEGGTTVDDAIQIAQMFHEAGNDILAVSTGGVTSHQRPNVGRLYQGTFSDQIRNATGLATMAVGGIASYGDANMMIASGRADMCAMARGHLYDPYFTLHAAQQQGYDDLQWPKEYGTATSLRMRDFW